MQGIVQGAMAPQGAPPPQQGPAGAPGKGFTPAQEEQLQAFTNEVLAGMYENGAAKDAARALKAAPGVATALAGMAYDMVAVVDEKTQGQLDDELLAPAALNVLGELVEVAQAAGVPVKGRDIGMATRMMLQRFLEEAGEDPSKLGQMFGQVNNEALGQQLDAEMGGEPENAEPPAAEAGENAQEPGGPKPQGIIGRM